MVTTFELTMACARLRELLKNEAAVDRYLNKDKHVEEIWKEALKRGHSWKSKQQ